MPPTYSVRTSLSSPRRLLGNGIHLCHVLGDFSAIIPPAAKITSQTYPFWSKHTQIEISNIRTDIEHQSIMRVPHVTINGASIGGLATALALHSKNLVPNLHINILDKNPYGNDGVGHGAGLNLQPHAVKMLDEIGLMEEVVASGWAPMNQQYFTNNGRLILNHPRGLNANPHGYPQVSIQQATLHGILERAVEDRLGPDVIKRGLEGLSYTQDEGGVNFVCKDTEGNRFNICTDAVIVADVLHSGMRKAVRQVHDNSESGLIKSGLNIYRGTALVDKVLDGHTVVRAGRSEGKLICYPLEAPKLVKNPDGSLGQKQMLNFVVEVSEESPPSGIFGSQDNLADHIASKLEGLNGDFRLPFLDHRKMLHEADFLKVSSMSVRDPLNAWCDGRVVLLGDAAHTMDLESSNVASSPFLDAAEIASVLEQKFNKSPLKSRQEICKPFQEYEEARLPTVVSVQQTFQEMIPEQVIDLVHNEVPGEVPIPKAYGECLLRALTKCQSRKKSDKKKATKGLTTPAAFLNKNIVANFSPVERVLLAANGSLQRTISAMTNNDVVVKPVMTSPRSNQFLDREVTLHLGSKGALYSRTEIFSYWL